jgi:hypothetical protein
MVDPKQIPDEVVKEALWAYNYASTDCYTTEEQDIAIAIAAALAAWPGACHLPLDNFGGAKLILPLQEPRT